VLHKQPSLEGALNGPLSSSGGVEADLGDPPVQLVHDQPGKLKGRRLAEAVDALNALGGTWQLVPELPPTTG
jgi:hypothetical protein